MKKKTNFLYHQSSISLNQILPLIPSAMPTKAIVLLNQTGTKESIPVVKLGDDVKQKQLIAIASDKNSTNIHSPITGKVSSTGFINIINKGLCAYIEITMGGFFSSAKNINERSISKFSNDDILNIFKDAGICEIGKENSKPIHEYLKLNEHYKVKNLVINALESKPYSNINSTLFKENSREIFKGLAVVQNLIKSEKIYIYADAQLESLKDIMLAEKEANNLDNLEIVFYSSKIMKTNDYLLAEEITGKRTKIDVPLSISGYITLNLNTLLSIYNAIFLNEVHIKHAINIAGNAIKTPKHLSAYLGTPISFLIDECGGIKKNKNISYIVGNMMQGYKITDLNTPITKDMDQILVVHNNLDSTTLSHPCTMCNKCVKACPRLLWPHMLYKAVHNQRFDIADNLKLDYCVECGNCSYVCPSHLPLSASFKLTHHYKVKLDNSTKAHKFIEKKEIAVSFSIPVGTGFKPNIELAKVKMGLNPLPAKAILPKAEIEKPAIKDTKPIEIIKKAEVIEKTEKVVKPLETKIEHVKPVIKEAIPRKVSDLNTKVISDPHAKAIDALAKFKETIDSSTKKEVLGSDEKPKTIRIKNKTPDKAPEEKS